MFLMKWLRLTVVKDQIYSREDIQTGQVDPKLFGEGTVYLFDNLPRHENHSKIRFLRPLGNTNYIKVHDFYSNKTAAFTHEEIKELVSNIK